MDQTTHDHLVGSIYNAAAGRTSWDPALEQLAHSLDAFAIHLIGVDKRSLGVRFSHTGGHAPAEMHLDLLRRYHQIDERLPVVVQNDRDTWFHCHEHFDERHVARSPFYQEFLIPYGGRYVSGIKLVDDDDMVVVMGIHRGSGSRPLDAATLTWVERLRVHMIEAIAIYRHLRDIHAERASASQILHGIRHPIMLVDAMRGLLFKNAAAQSLLRSTNYVVDRNGTLGCRDPKDDDALTIAIQDLDLHGEGRSAFDERASFVRLNRTSGGPPVGVYVSALRPREVMGAAFGMIPTALLVFHDPTLRPELDPFIVAEMFGLTPAEARVAVRLVRGQDAAAIAQSTAKSIETVRTQIKSLLSKAGVDRQAELVRLVGTLSPI